MVFWDDKLLTGNQEIDNQHKELCEIAGGLLSAFVNAESKEKIEPTLVYFEKYVKEHFDAEEKIQIEIKYPFYEQHKEEHDKFRQQIQKFRLDIAQKGVTEKIAQDFNLKIIDWLVFHLRETDGQIAEFINETNRSKQAW
jgi:hemerythrin